MKGKFLLTLWPVIASCSISISTIINNRCVKSCRNAYQAVSFIDRNKEAEAAPWQCPESGSELNFLSVYLCMRERCDGEVGLEVIRQSCVECGVGGEVPPFDITAGYTDEDISGMYRFDGKDPEVLDGPALPTRVYFYLWLHTLEATDYVHYYHRVYGWAMLGFWACVAAFGISHRLICHVSRGSKSFGKKDRGGEHMVWKFLKTRLFTPATFGQRTAQPFSLWMTIPPRVQSVTIMGFLLMNIFMSIHGYRLFPGNIYYPDVADQIIRYVSDRTGILSFANFPLIWLFGMRNNVVMWLTGWDFGTYNNFHRWVARIATLQAVIHSIGYTILILKQGGWSYFLSWWTLMFWWAGELATIFMCALLALSFYWFRRQNYGLFLISHIVLSALVLLTMLGHVSIFSGQYDALVWIPALIWLFDRVMRASRIIYFNSPRSSSSKAYATFNPPTKVVCLQVPYNNSIYKATPGTFFYLSTLEDFSAWESHPFTVADVEGRVKLTGEEEPLLMEDDERGGGGGGGGFKALTFLIRPYDRFTSRLRDLAASQWPLPAQLRVFVDGPYGHTQPLEKFDQVLFVIGGSGIVVPLSYLKLLTRSSSRTRVSIHWSVREAALVGDILSSREDLGGGDVELDVHLTTAISSSSSSSLHDELGGLAVSRSRGAGGAIWHFGRMDICSVIKEIGERKEALGSLAVVACGPARMLDEARKATVELMEDRGNRVEYFEESFQW